MLKQFMNSGSLLALLVKDAENEGKSAAQLAREEIAKNTQVADTSVKKSEAKEKEKEEEKDDDESEDEEDETDEDEEDEEELDTDGNPVEKKKETEEEKATREAEERQAAKAARKDARIQRRIDTAIAAQKKAEAEVLTLKQQLEANPDKKLTEAEVLSKAEAIAAERIAAQNLEKLQDEFNKACDKLQAAATAIDKEFTPKVVQMTEELGPIPSRVIGILSDLENGAEVLHFMVDDVDEAEKIYDLKDRPEKLAIAIVRISDKLAEAKKPKIKPLSKVPNQGDRIKPRGNVNSNTITGKESTEEYIAKRTRQREELRKTRGY